MRLTRLSSYPRGARAIGAIATISKISTIAVIAATLLAAGCSRKPATIDISPKKLKIYGLERSSRLTARLLDKKESPSRRAPPPGAPRIRPSWRRRQAGASLPRRKARRW